MQAKYETASDLYGQALEIAREINDRYREASCLSGLADIAQAQAHYKTASDLYGRALGLYEQIFGAEHPKTVAVREKLMALQKKE